MSIQDGRGRLSSIDQLPPEADPDIHWASAELAKRDRTQADILFELNDRLAVVGYGPISSSAFNRYSTRKTSAIRGLEEAAKIGAVVSERLGSGASDDITVLIVQMIKQQIVEIIEKGSASSKSLLELGRALNAVISAQKLSADITRKVKQEVRQKLDVATEAAAEGLVGLSGEADKKAMLKQIREELYGIFDK